MENYRPDQLRDEFVAPLISLIGEFTTDIQVFENLIKSGNCPKDYLPLNVVSAKKGIGFLRKLRRELHDKIEGVQDGTFQYRELALEKQRQKYHEKKSALTNIQDDP